MAPDPEFYPEIVPVPEFGPEGASVPKFSPEVAAPAAEPPEVAASAAELPEVVFATAPLKTWAPTYELFVCPDTVMETICESPVIPVSAMEAILNSLPALSRP